MFIWEIRGRASLLGLQAGVRRLCSPGRTSRAGPEGGPLAELTCEAPCVYHGRAGRGLACRLVRAATCLSLSLQTATQDDCGCLAVPPRWETQTAGEWEEGRSRSQERAEPPQLWNACSWTLTRPPNAHGCWFPCGLSTGRPLPTANQDR